MFSKNFKCSQHNLIHGDTEGAVERCQRCDREHFSFMWLPEVSQSTLKRIQPFFTFYLRQKIFPFQLWKQLHRPEQKVFVVKRHTGLARLFWSSFSSLNSAGRWEARIRWQKRDPGLLLNFFLLTHTLKEVGTSVTWCPICHLSDTWGQKKTVPSWRGWDSYQTQRGAAGSLRLTASETGSCPEVMILALPAPEPPMPHGPHPHVLPAHHDAVILQCRCDYPVPPSLLPSPSSCHFPSWG